MDEQTTPPVEELKRQTAEIKRSAKVAERQTGQIADNAERRTQFASDRTLLAAERTYAAWVRTGLFALASGIGARALLTGLMSEWMILADATALILFSVFCFGAAIWRHLQPGTAPPLPHVRQIPPAVLIVLNTFLALVSIAALVGMWSAR